MRETLYEQLATVERVRLHRLVAEAIEEAHGADVEEHLAQLAHHYLEAAAEGTGKQAIRYARLAAEQAVARMAFEEAGRLLGAALRVADVTGATHSVRAEMLLLLGRVQWRAGDEPAATESFRQAAQWARRAEAPALLAQAALGPGDVVLLLGVAIGGADREQIHLLEEALAGLGPEDRALRARLLGRLAAHLYWSESEERRDELSARSLELAREVDDPETIAYALTARHWAVWGPDNLEERLDTGREIVRIAERLEDRRLEGLGRIFLLSDLVESGDVAGGDLEAAAIRRISRERDDPTSLWFAEMYGAGRLIREGRFEEAERAANEAFAIGEPVLGGEPSWPGLSLALQLYCLRMFQGGLEDVRGAVEGMVSIDPTFTVWHCALAYILAETGDLEGARREVEAARGDGFEGVRTDVAWLGAMSESSLTVAILGDRDMAEELYGLLEPYRDRLVHMGPAAALAGPVSHCLALLATTIERFDDAERHFEHAVGQGRRIGAPPLIAWSQQSYAEMLMRRGGRGDRDRAVAMAREALTVARRIGMRKVAAQAEGLLRGAGARPEPPAAADRVTPTEAVLQRDGEYWTLAFGGPVVRLRDSKGLRYIAYLVARPGVEVHVLDLVAVANPAAGDVKPVGTEGLDGGPGDAGEILDATAREQYRARVEELREEIEEAERFNDPERAARAREEMDAIASELSAAVGLRGRPRRAGSPAERARVNVRNGISACLRTIHANDEALWRHLSNAVRTGTFCSYQPERPVDWSL